MENLSKNSDKKISHQNNGVLTNKNENGHPNDNKTHKQVEIRQNNNNNHLSFDINNHQKLMPLHSESMVDSKKINSCINKRCCLILGASLILVVLPPVMAIIYEEALFPNHKASDVYHDFGIVSFVVAGTIVGLVLLWHVIDHKKLWCKLMMNLIPEVIILFVLELILDKEYDDKEEKRRKRGRIIFYGASLLMSCVITLINNLCCKEKQEAQERRKLIDDAEKDRALSYLLSNMVKKSDVNQKLLIKNKHSSYTNLKVGYNNKNTHSNKQEKEEKNMLTKGVDSSNQNQNWDIELNNNTKQRNKQIESRNSVNKTTSKVISLQEFLQALVAAIKKFWPAKSCPDTYARSNKEPFTLQVELMKLGGNTQDLEKRLRKVQYSQRDIDYAFYQVNQKLSAIRYKHPNITIGKAITLLDQQQDKELKIEQEKTKQEQEKTKQDQEKTKRMKMRAAKIQEYKNKDKNLSEEDAIKKANAFFGLS